MFREKLARCTDDPLTLPWGDGLCGLGEAGAHLDLDRGENLTAARDDVNLADR